VLDTALVLAVAVLLGQRTAVHGVLLVAAAVAALALARTHVRPLAGLVAVIVFAASGVRAHRALVDADRARAVARDAIGPPSRCEGRAVVASSPSLRGGTLRATLDLGSVTCDGRALPPLRARVYGISGDVARGDVLTLVTQLAPTQLFFDPDLPDPRPFAARGGATASGAAVMIATETRASSLPAAIDRLRARVRARIAATYGDAVAPLARALVLGEEDLDPEDGEAFRRSGLAHLLAVSGTHLVLVVLGLVAGLRAVLVRIPPLAGRLDAGRISAAIGVAIAFLYADFAGGSGSAMRAAWMVSALLGARALGRRGSAPRALGLSAIAMAALDPLVAFDLSFLLSIAATAGLFTLGPPIAAWLGRVLPSWLAWLASPVSASVAASTACAPLIASMSPSLPVAGLVANVVAVPVGEAAALPLCLSHVLFGAIPLLERGTALSASGALLFVRAIARASSSLAWGAVPVPPPTLLQGAIVVVGVAAVACAGPWRWRSRLALVVAALLLAEGVARRDGAPKGELRVTFLDVGQGDAALVDLPDGALMLVDGGGLVGSPVDVGRSVIAPTLRARRRSRVDVAVLSHPHPDHFLGLASALPTVDVGELWDTGQGELEGAGPVYAGLLASVRARGGVVRRPEDLCGERPLGGATVSVLAPCPGIEPLSGANDNSFVVRIAYGERAVLLVGDAEHAEEARLLAAGARVRADVLKVGHHGSRTSTTRAFLDAVRPALAVVSSGVRNRFGHPHRPTLATLDAAGVAIHRTDRQGAAIWATDGKVAWLSVARRRGLLDPIEP
jgi:competence protein ComEC